MTKFKIRIRIPRTEMQFNGFVQYADWSFGESHGVLYTHIRSDDFEAENVQDVIDTLGELFGNEILGGVILDDRGIRAHYIDETGKWDIKPAMPQITERRVANWCDLRAMCIKHRYYTMGTNEEYSALADLVFKHSDNMSTEVLYQVAKDIMDHSTPESVAGMDVASMMFTVEYEACRHCFDVH